MLWQRKQKKVSDPLDLTQTQFCVAGSIRVAFKKNKPVTQVDIAYQSNSERMMVSKVLRTLEEKGFITRQEHKTGTRAKTIRLTTKGEIILQKAIAEVENADLVFFAAPDSKLSSFNKNMVQLIDKNSG